MKKFNDKRISSCTLYSHDHLHVNCVVIFLCHGLTNMEEERLDFFPRQGHTHAGWRDPFLNSLTNIKFHLPHIPGVLPEQPCSSG